MLVACQNLKFFGKISKIKKQTYIMILQYPYLKCSMIFIIWYFW